MRARAVVGEAGRNVVTGTTRAVVFAVVFLALVGGLAVADVRAVVAVLRGAADFRAAGATVDVLKADAAVDGRRCDALTGTGTVTAGAFRRGGAVQILAMPAAQITVIEATPGLIRLLPVIAQPVQVDPAVAGGVWVSADLATTLGATPGRVIATADGVATVAGVYTWADDARARDLGYAIITPVPADGTFDQCWTETWPSDPGLAGLAYLSLTNPQPMGQVASGQLNTSLGTTYDTGARLHDRLTRPVPWVAAVAGCLLGYVAVRTRRVENASALHARVPKADLAWQHLLEAAVWAGGSTVILAAGLLWAARLGNPDPGWTTWWTGLRTVLAGSAAVGLGVLAAVLTTREKHLFRYAKDR
jgi:hypothetical protein